MDKDFGMFDDLVRAVDMDLAIFVNLQWFDSDRRVL